MSGIAISSAVGLGVRVDISAGGGAADTEVGAALAKSEFQSDGDIHSINTIGSVDEGDWISPKSAAPGAYEIMAHQDSGDALDVTSDALDTWLALSSTRQWSISTIASGLKTASLTVSIRLGTQVLSSGVFALSAETL